MTTEELTTIVAQNSAAIAENTKSIAQLTNALLTLHESVKSLAAAVAAHDDSIDELRRVTADTQRQWQAYITTLPKT